MTMRLDQALVARGLTDSRARAQALISAGAVAINGTEATKASQKVTDDTDITLTADPLPYVSRAALKLKHGIEVFGLDPTGKTALDLGASTGGFTEILLKSGAQAVWAVDVGHGQIHDSLRHDPRVNVIEGQNVRDLQPGMVPTPDWIVSDLSFISLEKALPAPLALAAPGCILVALIKPQFEVGRAAIGKGGIVRDGDAVKTVRTRIATFLETLDWQILGQTTSPIPGGDGNTEYLIAARKRDQGG